MLTLGRVAMPPIDSLHGQWAVVRIYCENGAPSRFLPYLIRECQDHGIGCFVPLMRLRRQRIDRGRTYLARGPQIPVFPYTVFISTDDRSAPSEAISVFKKRIPTTTAVLSAVKDQKRLDSELKNLAKADPDDWFTTSIRKGQTVRVIAGPMMGVTGVVVDSCRGKCDVQLSVTLLGRAVQLEVPADFVEQV